MHNLARARAQAVRILVPASRHRWGLLGLVLVGAAIPLTDEIGFAMCALFIGWHLLRTRRQ